MTAAEAGNTAKEAFVPRTVLVAALTAKATTSPIPAAMIMVPVTAIIATVIVRCLATKSRPIPVRASPA